LQNQDHTAGGAQPLIDIEPEALAREDFGYRLAQLSQGLPFDAYVVIRHPVKSFESAVGRYERAESNEPGSGKTVPVNYAAATHEAVIENVPELMERFADDPLVRWHFIDNRGLPIEARELSAEEGLRLLGSIDTTDLRSKFNEVLDNTKLTKRDLERFGDQSLPSEFGSAGADEVGRASSFAR